MTINNNGKNTDTCKNKKATQILHLYTSKAAKTTHVQTLERETDYKNFTEGPALIILVYDNANKYVHTCYSHVKMRKNLCYESYLYMHCKTIEHLSWDFAIDVRKFVPITL